MYLFLIGRYREHDLVKLDIQINGEHVEAFSSKWPVNLYSSDLSFFSRTYVRVAIRSGFVGSTLKRII
jgi:hypothetical protein